MRRIIVLLTVGLVMAAMMLSMAMPAFAAVGRVGAEHRALSCELVAFHHGPPLPAHCRT